MPISAEEFARWRDDRVTRWVFKALERNADECHEAWDDASWMNGAANQLLLIELRTRADALRSMTQADYSAFCQTLEESPIYDEG